MAKTYKILVNDGNNTDIKPVRVEQGVGDKGVPVRVLVKAGWRVELHDEAKGKGLAPNQMRLKRMDKDLAIYFDNSQRADVVLEDFYASPTNKPQLMGLAENGGTYEYVPQDPAVSSMPSELKDDSKPVIVSLGGAPLGDAFVLSGLPVAAAAGGGGTGWLIAGGAGAAAAAGGGGGGGGGAGPAAPAKATGALAAESDTGHSNSDGITRTTTPFYTGKAEANKNIAVTVDGNTYLGTTGPDGTYKIQLTNPLGDGTHVPSIKVTDPTTGLSSTSDGTPFTIDTSGTPDANDSATVTITSISDDTGTKTDDFITSDNTLNYQGTVTSFTANGARVRLELKNNAGVVVRTEDVAFTDAGAWTWSDQATARADGKYTLVATMVDAAGNVITGAKTSTSQAVFISHSGLTAVNDTGVAVEAGGVNNATPGSNATGNVLSNDTTVDAAVTKKVVPISNQAGIYGTLNIGIDGEYSYTVNNDNAIVNALRDVNVSGATTLTDTFTYTVTDLTGQTKEATLAITIQGANDIATVVRDVSSYVTMSDADANEQRFTISVQANKYYKTDWGGKFSFTGIETISSNQFKGNFPYTDTDVVDTAPANTSVHELFTVTSVDGTASYTFDVTTNKDKSLDIYYGVLGNSDTLMLNIAGMRDLTGTALHSVEKIDVTGSAATTITLNLASLMQADVVSGVHKLWIDGDAADVVQFAGYSSSSATVIHSGDAGGVLGYNRYIFDSTHELLINTAIASVTAVTV